MSLMLAHDRNKIDDGLGDHWVFVGCGVRTTVIPQPLEAHVLRFNIEIMAQQAVPAGDPIFLFRDGERFARQEMQVPVRRGDKFELRWDVDLEDPNPLG